MALTEREAHEWLCTQLGSLRVRARDGGWEERLDRVVREVQADGSAVRACRALGFRETPGNARGSSAGVVPLGRLNLDPVTRQGEYVCPKARCARRDGAGEDGREPRCGLYGVVMDLRPLDEHSP